MRTGGSQTFDKDGKLLSSEEPTKDHPEGNRARDAEGKPLDGAQAEAPPAPKPTKQKAKE